MECGGASEGASEGASGGNSEETSGGASVGMSDVASEEAFPLVYRGVFAEACQGADEWDSGLA